ncbi:MAG: hypothetical protein JO180_03630 [Gemmatirosa sp.]|nr:hypothetical protein [Gemmatirosa sp.]
MDETFDPSRPTTPSDEPTRPGGATRAAIALSVAGTAMIAAAYLSAFATIPAPAWAAWLLAVGVPLSLVGTMALGAARAGRLPPALVWTFALVGAMLAGGFGLALALPSDLGSAEPLLLGLPRRAAIIVYGVGLLPVFVLPAAYAWTFDAQTLRPEDLARVRAAGVARRTAERAS